MTRNTTTKHNVDTLPIKKKDAPLGMQVSKITQPKEHVTHYMFYRIECHILWMYINASLEISPTQFEIIKKNRAKKAEIPIISQITRRGIRNA